MNKANFRHEGEGVCKPRADQTDKHTLTTAESMTSADQNRHNDPLHLNVEPVPEGTSQKFKLGHKKQKGKGDKADQNRDPDPAPVADSNGQKQLPDEYQNVSGTVQDHDDSYEKIELSPVPRQREHIYLPLQSGQGKVSLFVQKIF